MTELTENLQAKLQKLVDDKIPGLIIQRNYHRQFADGVVLARLIQRCQKGLIDLHNYPSAFSIKQKKSNWETLSRKALTKLEISMDKKQIDEAAKGEANIIDEILIKVGDQLGWALRPALTFPEQQTDVENGDASQSSIPSGCFSPRPIPGKALPKPTPRIPPPFSPSKIAVQSQFKPKHSVPKRRSIKTVPNIITQSKVHADSQHKTTMAENLRARLSTEYIFSKSNILDDSNSRGANDKIQSQPGIVPLGNKPSVESKSSDISLELIHKTSKVSEDTSICEADDPPIPVKAARVQRNPLVFEIRNHAMYNKIEDLLMGSLESHDKTKVYGDRRVSMYKQKFAGHLAKFDGILEEAKRAAAEEAQL